MDSLLANYASSDEDEEQHINQPPPPSQHRNPSESLQPQKPPFASSLFSSLPKPQSASSLFTSLPPPKSQLSSTQFTPKSASSSIPTSPNQTGGNELAEEKGLHMESNSGSKVSSGLFSSLPAPKSQPDSAPISTASRSSSASQKRVVQFRPPVIQSSFKSDEKDEDDDEDDEYLDKNKPQVINPNSSFQSFISSMPAPMNSATLGMSGTGGSGRRAVVETSTSSLNSDAYKDEKKVGIESYANSSSVQDSSNDGSVSGSLGAVEGQLGSGVDVADWGQPGESYAGYEAYESYENYEGYESYGNEGNYDQTNWENVPSTWVAPEVAVPGIVESVARGSGKRGRDRIPTEIVEVSQDELMKNRPRQDQAKLTGIAFGPAYQPAPSGGAGKPTKLHKRKHQIGSLYFDMRQKEMELSERRAKGMLTKAETQAKYGW